MGHLPSLKNADAAFSEADEYLSNDVHAHFVSSGQWHWVEVANEGKRLLEALSGQSVTDGSVIDSVIDGVAAQSRHGAYAAIAAMLGLDVRALQAIVLDWEENQDSLPLKITFDELRTKILTFQSIYGALESSPSSLKEPKSGPS